jgi:hypothetical protein
MVVVVCWIRYWNWRLVDYGWNFFQLHHSRAGDPDDGGKNANTMGSGSEKTLSGVPSIDVAAGAMAPVFVRIAQKLRTDAPTMLC